MAFDPDAFLAETSTPTKGFDPDAFLEETKPHSIGEFGKNLGTGALKMGKGITKGFFDPLGLQESVAARSLEPTKQSISQGIETIKGMPSGLVKEAKRVGIPEMGKAITKTVFDPLNISGEGGAFEPQKEAVKKVGEAFYEDPVTTALDFAGPFIGGGKKVGAPPPEVAVAEKLAQVETPPPSVRGVGAISPEEVLGGKISPPVELPSLPKSPSPVDIGSEAADILKKPIPPAPPPPPPPAPKGTLKTIAEKVPGDVKNAGQQVLDYVKGQYGKAAQKPGMAQIMADYLKDHARGMSLREMGASSGQLAKIERNFGTGEINRLADYGLDKGLVGPKIGTIGREKIIPQRMSESGGAVGGFRKIASDRGAVHNKGALLETIQSELNGKYLKPGLHSGERGLYSKALAEVRRSGLRADEVADKITELFQESKKLDVLKKPSGPIADVARILRRENDNLISKNLKPEEMTIYENALEDYGALKQLNEFVKRRGRIDKSGRLGPGSGISRAMVQKFLDSVGYRFQAKAANNLADFIRKNPDVVSRPKDIFRKYIDEAVEAADDAVDINQ